MPCGVSHRQSRVRKAQLTGLCVKQYGVPGVADEDSLVRVLERLHENLALVPALAGRARVHPPVEAPPHAVAVVDAASVEDEVAEKDHVSARSRNSDELAHRLQVPIRPHVLQSVPSPVQQPRAVAARDLCSSSDTIGLRRGSRRERG